MGDVRGGISITIPYKNYADAARAEQRSLLLLHTIFLILGLALIWLVGWRLLFNVSALEKSTARIRTLEGLLPICSYCKKIRTAGADPMVQESWHPFEGYISARTDTSFTHSICRNAWKNIIRNSRLAALIKRHIPAIYLQSRIFL